MQTPVVTLLTIVLLNFANSSIGQQKQDSCTRTLHHLKPYFLETGDTVIRKERFRNGWTLAIRDSSFKVIRFCVGFHYMHAKGSAYAQLCVNGNSVSSGERQFMNYARTAEDRLFIDAIWVEKNGIQYCIPPVVYWLFR